MNNKVAILKTFLDSKPNSLQQKNLDGFLCFARINNVINLVDVSGSVAMGSSKIVGQISPSPVKNAQKNASNLLEQLNPVSAAAALASLTNDLGLNTSTVPGFAKLFKENQQTFVDQIGSIDKLSPKQFDNFAKQFGLDPDKMRTLVGKIGNSKTFKTFASMVGLDPEMVKSLAEKVGINLQDGQATAEGPAGQNGQAKAEEQEEPTTIEGQTKAEELDGPATIEGQTKAEELDGPATIEGQTKAEEQEVPATIEGQTKAEEQEVPATIEGQTKAEEQEVPATAEEQTKAEEQEVPATIEGQTKAEELEAPATAEEQTGIPKTVVGGGTPLYDIMTESEYSGKYTVIGNIFEKKQDVYIAQYGSLTYTIKFSNEQIKYTISDTDVTYSLDMKTHRWIRENWIESVDDILGTLETITKNINDDDKEKWKTDFENRGTLLETIFGRE